MASIQLSENSQFLLPRGGDKVYKDECLLCYRSPISGSGVFVSLRTFEGYCEEHVKLFTKTSDKEVFLQLKKIPTQILSNDAAKEEPPTKKPTRLAIGVEGGFDVESDKIEYSDENSVVILGKDGSEIDRAPLPNQSLPEQLQLVIAAVLAHQGASMQDNTASWEGEKRQISRHADTLVQQDNGVKIPPRGWKCARCDLVENLWMNLTDGTILCGRRYYDGSGGNNHAVEYYDETKYPLAVKLGTITPEGADVYSYEDDNMVENPKLVQHLEHFGINISKMEKTDKTMTELEIEANLMLKAEWDTIQESGKKLTPLYGKGYTGMINLGNSCYLNSVMQVLFSMEEFKNRYSRPVNEIYKKSECHPAEDFETQMAKVADGLLSGKYSLPVGDECNNDDNQGIRPQMFKSLIGKGHPEFASNRQQDAHEFLLHLLSAIDRKELLTGSASNPRNSFSFQFEDRVECMASKKVSYKKREDVTLVLPIPLEKAVNRAEFDEFEAKRKELESKKQTLAASDIVRLRIPMSSCLDAFIQTDIIDDFYSPAIKGLTQAKRSTRFSTFPDYLVVQLRRFTVSDDWVPKKLDVSIDVLDELDLSHLRSTGIRPDEQELPEEVEEIQEPQIDESVVLALTAMGFPIEGCRKAVYHTSNTGLENAMEWVLQHIGDEDFADNFELSSSRKSNSNFTPNDEALAMVQSMGFTSDQAIKALRATDNNLERAIDWIFSHSAELDALPMETDDVDMEFQATSQPAYNDGPGKYRLFAFISHMGTSTSCGHYVCHIYKEGRWVIYNDRKVAVSENPPKDLAYIYFYKRTAN